MKKKLLLVVVLLLLGCIFASVCFANADKAYFLQKLAEHNRIFERLCGYLLQVFLASLALELPLAPELPPAPGGIPFWPF